jgi:FrmR/RcnR family transcriptional regulator, repressor of frmRAB operon
VHSICNKDILLGQIRWIGGQFATIEGSIKDDLSCSYILQIIAAARGSLDSLLLKVVDEHIRLNVIGLAHADDSERVKPAKEVLKLMQTYLK